MSDVKSWDLPPLSDKEASPKAAAGFAAPEKKPAPTPELKVPANKAPEPEVYRAPTAEELTELFEQTKREAYEEGLALGKKEGFDAGFAEGQKEGLTQGLVDGQKQGEQQGYDESLKRGQAEIKQQVQKLQSIMRQLNQPLAGQEAELERAIVALSLQVASAVITHEVKTSTNRIEELVRTAMHALPHGADYIQLLLHPEDTTLISQYAPELVKDTTVKADATITRGGVMVKTNQSLIDLTLDRAWQQQIASIMEQADLEKYQQSLFDHGQTWSQTLEESVHESPESEVEPISSVNTGPTGDSSRRPIDPDGGVDAGGSRSERDGGGPVSN